MQLKKKFCRSWCFREIRRSTFSRQGSESALVATQSVVSAPLKRGRATLSTVPWVDQCASGTGRGGREGVECSVPSFWIQILGPRCTFDRVRKLEEGV